MIKKQQDKSSVFVVIKVYYVVARQQSAVQRQKAVSAYFTSKHILPFGFAEQ